MIQITKLSIFNKSYAILVGGKEEMINIAVCDDEITLFKTKFNALLQRALVQSQIQAEITYYSDGVVLFDEFKNRNTYDIIILDIDMPSINGKELARKLRAVDSEFTLAFFTAYEKEVFSTIPIGISAFIPKDFDDEKILSALTELFNAFLSKNPQYDVLDVLIDGKPSTAKIQASNIYYFKFVSKNIFAYTYNDTFILTERVFEKVVEKFRTKGFYKINRTCIVNISKVYEVLEESVIMDNGDKLIVSRRAKKELLHKVTMLPIIRKVNNGDANFRV